MKTTTLLLIASLLANVAFVAVLATRSPARPPAPIPAAATTSSAAASAAGRNDALRAALLAGNTAALESAGLDPALAREIVLGRTFSRLVARLSGAKPERTDDRWWRNTPGSTPSREQQLALRRELTDALAAAGIDPAGLFGASDNAALAFLPAAKRDALRRITQDYDEMIAKFSAGGVQLASDREKLKLLRAERERDIASLLSPEELLAYEMRTSPTAANVRSRYGDGIQSEEDYRKIYALQKAFDEKFPLDALSGRVTPDLIRARSDAQRQLQDDIRAALGETGYASLRRATDSDLRTVDALVNRLSLPPATTDRVATARETFAAASQRISADTAVPLPQRRAQIQELGTRARAEVQQALGTEAADAYVQRSPWLGMLQNGLAYSTAPQPGSPGAIVSGMGNQSVYPVMPAGAPSGSGVRQMIYSSTTTTNETGADHGGGVMVSPGAMPRENVQVMTFSTATTEGVAAPADGTAPVRQTIIVAPPPAPPPK